MAKKTDAPTTEKVSADEFWEGVNGELPEGFEEVERLSAKRLEPGEQVIGVLLSIEERTGLNPNTGEESQYKVYSMKLDNGAIRGIGGAPVLDSMVASIPNPIGKRMLFARGKKNVEGRRGRQAGNYRVAVAGVLNGKAKA